LDSGSYSGSLNSGRIGDSVVVVVVVVVVVEVVEGAP